MNRLDGVIFYLAGPMDLIPGGGVEWRDMVTPKLWAYGAGVLNPCDKPSVEAEDKETPEFRQSIVTAKDTGDFDYVRAAMKPIINVDYRMVDVCHAMLLYIDIDHHACGSYHEDALAVMQHKPVLVMCKQGKSRVPNWMFGMLPHQLFFGSFDDLFGYLDHINSASEIDTLSRWHFFDWNKVFGRKR